MKINMGIIVITMSLGLALLTGNVISKSAAAQETSSEAKTEKATARDGYQRSAEIYEFKKAAKSGPARGEEIYYYKCWYCHNEYAKGAPRLDEMQKRGKLMSGNPVNNDTVSEKIRKGGPAMPAYGTTMSDADMKDLMSFLLGGKCCFDSSNPPANPRYRAK